MNRPPMAQLQTALRDYQAKSHDAALQKAKALVAAYPHHVACWKLLGAAQHALHQFEKALEAKHQVVCLAPQDGEAHSNLSLLLMDMGRSEEALFHGQKAVACSPDVATFHAHLGHLLLNLGRNREAQHCFDAALARDRRLLSAHRGLGAVHQIDGQLPLAISHDRQALILRLETPSRLLPSRPKPSFSTARHENLLWRTLAQLAKAGVHAFAIAGTLLGLVRDGQLLPHDKDMDIGLPLAEQKTAQDCLLAHGWTRHMHHKAQVINPWAYRHLATGMMLDLFFFVKEIETGKILSGIWMDNIPFSWNRITEYSDLTLHPVQRPEGTIWALSAPEHWLSAIYGDWKTPDPDFDTVIAAQNLRGFSILTECYALSRIMNHWQKGALRKAVAITRHARVHLPTDRLLQDIEQHLAAAIEQNDA